MEINKSYYQKGVILPLLAIGMLAILGAAGMALDLGHGYLNKSRLQNSVDAAALSGARTLHLTQDAVTASLHARQTFTEHLEGEMSGLIAANLTLQYSNTLNPFTIVAEDSATVKNYIRVVYQDFDTPFTFARVIPGVADKMAIAATAVAGAIPLGGPGSEVCDIAPMMMCGTTGDTDCTDDNECYGLEVGTELEYQLKTGSNAEGDADSCSMDGYWTPDTGPNAGIPQWHGFNNCVVSPPGVAGPGNFQLIRLGDSTGANDLRDNMAGAFDQCLVQDPLSPTVPTEPGNTVGPSIQGFNTRFGRYLPPMHNNGSQVTYPPDVILTDRIPNVAVEEGIYPPSGTPPNYWFSHYKADAQAAIIASQGNEITVPIMLHNSPSTARAARYRRLIGIPVVDCSGINGQSNPPVLGFGCFYLTREMEEQGGGQESYIYGQFVGGCELSGTAGEAPPEVGTGIGGPHKIILYKDPLDSAA